MIGIIRARTFFCEKGEVCTSPLLLLLSTDSMSGKRLAAMLLGVIRACTLALPNRKTMSYASVFTAFKRIFELKRLSSNDDRSNKGKNVLL